jgi:hypothetical protein
MLTNFSNINQWVNIDHEDPDTNKAGYHKQCTMFNQAPPGIGTADGTYFVQDGNPWFQNAGGAFPLAGTDSETGDGYTVLPGGTILEWGRKASPGASGSVTFPLAFPNNCFNVQITQQRNSSSSTQGMYLNGVPGLSSFDYNGSSSSSDAIYWVAIGN